MAQQTLDVSMLIDERRWTGFNYFLVILSFFVIGFNGYNIMEVAFSVPYIVREWGMPSARALGPVFSASLFGILFGAPVFGWVGDRYGRKVAAIASCIVIGATSLLVARTSSLTELMYLRIITGLGMGGLIPAMIAINGEYAPRRHRATAIIVFFTGMTLGGAAPATVCAWLVPTMGWRVVYYIGGIMPLVMACLVALWLPESVKFLALHERTRGRAVKVLKRLEPSLDIGPQTKLIVSKEKEYGAFRPIMLFKDGMASITLLLWACFVFNLMGYYFLINWIPTLLTQTKVLSVADAAFAASLIQIAGTVCGLLIARPMETKGFWPVAILFVLAIPSVGLIGFVAASKVALMSIIALSGFCLMGLQFGLNAASAMMYPTAFRTNAVGWAFGVGRVGSVLGPIIGGFLIQMHLSLKSLFMIVSIAFVFGAIACILLARLYRQRFRGAGLGEREVRPAAGQVVATS